MCAMSEMMMTWSERKRNIYYFWWFLSPHSTIFYSLHIQINNTLLIRQDLLPWETPFHHYWPFNYYCTLIRICIELLLFLYDFSEGFVSLFFIWGVYFTIFIQYICRKRELREFDVLFINKLRIYLFWLKANSMIYYYRKTFYYGVTIIW